MIVITLKDIIGIGLFAVCMITIASYYIYLYLKSITKKVLNIIRGSKRG